MRSHLLAASLVAVACSRSQPEPVTTKPEPTSAAASVTASATASATASTTASPPVDAGPLPDKLDWTAPAKLKEEPGAKPMRIATYHAPKVGSDTEEPTLVVSHAGGGLDANIERWHGQFNPITKKSRTERVVGSIAVTIVETHGTFLGGMNGTGSKEKHMLLGAIVPVKDGAYFFKMVGPEASVEAARSDFDALVGSLHSAP